MQRPRWFLLAALLCASAVPAGSADAPAYRMPPQVVTDILTAPRVPRRAPSVSPDGGRMILRDSTALIPIAVLAEPVEKLAGLEVLPEFLATRAQLKGAASGFGIVSLPDGRAVRAGLPAGARLGRTAWSGRGDRVACALYAPGGAEVWVVEAATGEARRLDGVRLNTVLGATLEWIADTASCCAAWCPRRLRRPRCPIPCRAGRSCGWGSGVRSRSARLATCSEPPMTRRGSPPSPPCSSRGSRWRAAPPSAWERPP